MNLTVAQLQIDNQLSSAVYPVLLQPSWKDERTNAAASSSSSSSSAAAAASSSSRPAALELRLQANTAAKGVLFFETISLRLQTLHLMVDTLLMKALLLYLYELHSDLVQIFACLLSAFLPAADTTAAAGKPMKIYAHWLNISRCACSSRAAPSPEASASRPSARHADRRSALLNSVGALLSNVDRAPIKLKALVVENVFAPAATLAASIGASYKEQVLSQLYKVLLSFEVLGNPRGLFTKMGTGVHDFFYEPMVGLFKGPEDFQRGLMRGGQSFHDNVLMGIGDSIHKTTGLSPRGWPSSRRTPSTSRSAP